MKARKPYHHGALQPALLKAVGELIEEKGIENLSLRECARRAGVSWTAPTHHFGNKTGLLTAFATEGFERLLDYLEQNRQAAGSAPQGQLAAVGLAYIEFAFDNPAHFRVMFRTELLNDTDLALETARKAAFSVLADCLAACDEVLGRATNATFESRRLLAWCAVHGFASLSLDGGLRFGKNAALTEACQMIAVLWPSLSAGFTDTSM